RFTLLKAVLGASPLYTMSIFKAPLGVVKKMESIRNKFFNGADLEDNKMTWIAWDKFLASKERGGLGVSSFHALNRALILKWVWRFISQDRIKVLILSLIVLNVLGMVITPFSGQILGRERSFLGMPFLDSFALETDKNVHVADKLVAGVVSSFRRSVRGGREQQQWLDLTMILATMSLSSVGDRWTCNLYGDGSFQVRDVRNYIDAIFLPSFSEVTRWVNSVPIKINIFAWHTRRDCLPTRANLIHRWFNVDSALCPICLLEEEDVHHVLFRCQLAQAVLRRACRWWDLEWQQSVNSITSETSATISTSFNSTAVSTTGDIKKHLACKEFNLGTCDSHATLRMGNAFIPVACLDSGCGKSLWNEDRVKQKDDGIFIRQNKYVADILKKFDFPNMKTASTPIESNKALIKDAEFKDVDVHLYRSMIGSLMYLTASMTDIMFAVCACARLQVTPRLHIFML
nr:RNA-directed DNA polymerase, eukaryota [Tanacetum cinerariifolium]